MARRHRKQDSPSRGPLPPPRPSVAGSRAGWHILLLLAATLVIYGNSLSNGFVSDDDFQVLSNPLIRDVHNLPRLFTTNVWAFAGTGMSNYYRPLHMIVYMAEYHLFNFDPFSWHVVNLGFHVAALIAAYFLLRALAGESLAFWASLWFALHPMHVEAVIWVAVVTDLLCGLALFTGMYCYHRARTGGNPLLFHALAVLAFFCGLLMKETALVFPALLLAYEFLYQRNSLLAILRGAARYLPYAVAFGLYLALRLHALGRFAPAKDTYRHWTPGELFFSVPALFAQYVGKLLLPVNLNYYYVFDPVTSLTIPSLAGFALLAGIVAAVFALRQAQPLLSFALAWFLITLAPVLNIPNVGENVFTERYLYIPSLGFCLLGAWSWLRLRERAADPNLRRVADVALAVLFLFYAVQTIRRNPDWKDDLTLFTKTAEQSPNSATTLANLGYIHYVHGHLDRSIELYDRALELAPQRAITHNNLGNSLSDKGQLQQAIEHLTKATELDKSYFSAWLNLGLVYAKEKEWSRAVECYDKGIAIKPDFPEALTARGLAFWALGQQQEAMASYRKALQFRPEYIEAHINLASALSETGAPDEAIEQLLGVLRLQPAGPHASVVHYNLGVNYERKKQWKAARDAYERALTLNPAFREARQKVDYFRARFPAESPPAPLSPLPRPY
jgi:tetratricopeptide (TPR) repeat protein